MSSGSSSNSSPTEAAVAMPDAKTNTTMTTAKTTEATNIDQYPWFAPAQKFAEAEEAKARAAGEVDEVKLQQKFMDDFAMCSNTWIVDRMHAEQITKQEAEAAAAAAAAATAAAAAAKQEAERIQTEQMAKHVAEAAAAAAAVKSEAERARLAERSKQMMVAAAAAAKQEAERIQAEHITKQEAEVGEESIYPHPCLTPLHVTQWCRGGGMMSLSFL
jgi:hypothetical protein